MSKHTPGPWTVVQDTGAEDDYYVITEKEDVLATGLTEADADLIAAAPDLLAALQNIMGMAQAHVNRAKALRHNKGKPVVEAMEADLAAARAAIAKAEGAS
jgi:hypothetical protein